MARFKKAVKGFTLVELLIVVAIIGVLSTIGVPTFRRMVIKAKKSEAKVALGGLFTVESAFYTEYNTYHNRINKIGFEIEGSQRLYDVGFPLGTCLDEAATPTSSSAVGATLAAQYTGFFDTTPLPFKSVMPRQIGQTTIDTSGATPTAANRACHAANVSADGTTYKASATGAIAPGVGADSPVVVSTTARYQDVWTINETRQLQNKVDGTN